MEIASWLILLGSTTYWKYIQLRRSFYDCFCFVYTCIEIITVNNYYELSMFLQNDLKFFYKRSCFFTLSVINFSNIINETREKKAHEETSAHKGTLHKFTKDFF